MQNYFYLFNKWETKKLIIVILSLQLLILGSIGLDYIGFSIPLLRQAAGIVYLTFIPGILILRLLRLSDLHPLEFLLYSIGLSIFFLMFSGLFINLLYPVLGFSKPLSEFNIIFIIILFTFIMSVLLYKFDIYKNTKTYPIEINPISIKYILYHSILVLILSVSILGTFIINLYSNGIFLLILIVLITILLLFICFDKFIIEKYYPVTIFIISLSILYSISLISNYLTGYDIQIEYYFYNLVEKNLVWNSYIPDIPERMLNMNAMLSVTILPLIYNKFLNINSLWIFKIIFPFIFAFSFVGLYYAYSKQIDNKKAFFSVIIILSFIYYMSFEMLSLARQMIAQLFFVLLLVLMLNKEISHIKKYTLYIIFASSMVVSHYGLSYIYMFILISVFFIGYLSNKFKYNISNKSFFIKDTILYFVVFTLFWYIYVSNGSVFNSIIRIGDYVFSNIQTEFFSSESRQRDILMALGLKSGRIFSFGREIHHNIQIITQLFIIIGFFFVLTKNKFKLNRDYILFLPVSLGLIFVSIVLPYFSSETMNMTRLYQITLLILAPLSIIGGEALIGKLLNLKKDLLGFHKSWALKLLVLFILIPYFIFNSGFVYEITKDEPLLTPLGIERILTSGSNLSKASLNDADIPEQDIIGAIWLSIHRNSTMGVYTTIAPIFMAYTASDKYFYDIYNETEFFENNLIFLRYENIKYDIFSAPSGLGELKIMSTRKKMNEIPLFKHIIYDNGGSQIYLFGRTEEIHD